MSSTIKTFVCVLGGLILLAWSFIPLELWLPFASDFPSWMAESTLIEIFFNPDMIILMIIALGLTGVIVIVKEGS